MDRPLDALNAAKGKKVIAELKDGSTYVGTLQAFDIHINLVLDDTEHREDGEVKRKLGRVLIRGDSVKVVSPSG